MKTVKQVQPDLLEWAKGNRKLSLVTVQHSATSHTSTGKLQKLEKAGELMKRRSTSKPPREVQELVAQKSAELRLALTLYKFCTSALPREVLHFVREAASGAACANCVPAVSSASTFKIQKVRGRTNRQKAADGRDPPE